MQRRTFPKRLRLFHHVFAKHVGDVAMANCKHCAQQPQTEWPRRFFHLQFALKASERRGWDANRSAADGAMVSAACAADIRITVMEFSKDGTFMNFTLCHVVSLPELFVRGYREYSALELYFYYNNCMKVVRKRKHAWGGKDTSRSTPALQKIGRRRVGFRDTVTIATRRCRQRLALTSRIRQSLAPTAAASAQHRRVCNTKMTEREHDPHRAKQTPDEKQVSPWSWSPKTC